MTDSKARNLADLLSDGAVGTDEIADGAITNTKLAEDAVPETPRVLKPSPSSPSNGATDIGEEPTLNGGGFFSLYGRSHALSRFQVSDDDQFNNIVYDTGEISATTTTTIPEGTLQSGETTYYWRVYYEDDNGTESEYSDTQSFTTQNFFGLTATGGTVTDITDGGVNYRVHTFTSSGTFDVTSEGGDVEYLVVAGGGSGGSNRGGGGGGGGLLNNTTQVSTQTYSITVGAGGTPVQFDTIGSQGGDSSLSGITAIGGGGGGSQADTGNLDGGSGGGEGGNNSTGPGAGVNGQGFDGGAAGESAGGGGGASESGFNGGDGGDTNGGDGGDGLDFSSKFGTAYGENGAFAGGGGGQGTGIGGLGGGTNGADIESDVQDAAANTGGGGGGGRSGYINAAGGSGIVIIRYQI